MRYFLSGFGLFLLLAFFVSNWYAYRPVRASMSDVETEMPGAVIKLGPDMLLRTADYEVMDRLARRMRHQPQAILRVEVRAPEAQLYRVQNMLTVIFQDQGVDSTRIDFFRTITDPKVPSEVLFRIMP